MGRDPKHITADLDSACKSDFIAEMDEAKNSLRSGFSPRQWVFGTNPLRDDDYGTQDFNPASPDAKFGRLEALRLSKSPPSLKPRPGRREEGYVPQASGRGAAI